MLSLFEIMENTADIKPGALVKLKEYFPLANLQGVDNKYPAIILHNDFLEQKGHPFMEIIYRTNDSPLMYLATKHVAEHTFSLPKNYSGRLTHHNTYNAHKFLWGDKVWIFLIEEEDTFGQYFCKAHP